MASVYPGSLDSLSTAHIDNVGEPVHNSTINDLADAVNKIEAALGTNPRKGGLFFDVKAYGALGDGATDDTAAIVAAYTAVPSTGGILYFPAGNYVVNTVLSFTNAKPVAIMGAGPNVSVFRQNVAAGDFITVNGPSLFAMSNIGFQAYVNRNSGTYNVRVSNCGRVQIHDVYMANGAGGLFMFDTCTFLQMVNCQGDANTGTPGTALGTCLRIKACGGTVSNCHFRTVGGFPALWITGTTTSLNIANSTFSGGGPVSSFTVSTVTSDAAKFTVTTSATHDFRVGDFIVLRGMTPATYNDVWRVATVPTGTTLTVTTTANPGTSSVNGTAESMTACGYVSNADGAVNEVGISNCLFEGWYTNLYGYVAFYLDGRRGPAGNQQAVSGWRLNGNYYDFGNTGLLISGSSANASFEPTTNGISVTGGVFSSVTRGVHIEQANNVAVNGIIGGGPVSVVADHISAATALYIHPGVAAPFAQGIVVGNSTLGATREWSSLRASYTYGVVIDDGGTANQPQDISLVGNTIMGATQAILFTGGGSLASRRYVFQGNNVNSGTFPLGSTNYLPSVASATTIDLTNFPHETIKITGTTNIGTVNGAWVGREVTLIFVGALSLVTAGNLAIGANRTILAGDAVKLIFDGTSWYVR